MNKLVIVGNGFDLAHGLPTSYKNFIDEFWASFHKNHQKSEIRNLFTFNTTYLGNMPIHDIKNYNDFTENLEKHCLNSGYDFIKERLYCRNKKTSGFSIVFQFKNTFFKVINQKNSIQNWVDIENEYYRMLKRELKKEISSYSGSKLKAEENQKIKNKDSVIKLNHEFEEIRLLFIEYLERNIAQKFNLNEFKDKNWIKLNDLLKPISIFNNESKLFEEFNLKGDLKEIEQIFEKEKNGEKINTKTYVLNFNYTTSTSQYLYEIFKLDYPSKLNHIHGVLSNKTNNQINFGFGDEMDEDYKFLENLNDNEYLKNFKSFKYSQNGNYKNLLNYIDSDKFQVYIMGHSCGLSDRTLLNTIFEHENCRSIKVFYHKREDGTDNFTETIQNISRHFNDKKEMRAKLVNKSLCQPLPQDIRFEKKEG